MVDILQPPLCVHCDSRRFVRVRAIVALNGTRMYRWQCLDCNQSALGYADWLNHFDVNRGLAFWRQLYPERVPSSIDDIEVAADYSSDQICYVCGAPGCEYNHFMPQKLKAHPDVVDDWVINANGVTIGWHRCAVYLCKKHHRIWHDVLAPLSALAAVRNGDTP